MLKMSKKVSIVESCNHRSDRKIILMNTEISRGGLQDVPSAKLMGIDCGHLLAPGPSNLAWLLQRRSL
jgi:hypothetical protein